MNFEFRIFFQDAIPTNFSNEGRNPSIFLPDPDEREAKMNPHFPANAEPIKLYRHTLSGHSHRVELMLAFLELPYEAIDLDLANGAHKQPDYVKISPFGQVPAIDDNGVTLSDSNAILTYFYAMSGAVRCLRSTSLNRRLMKSFLRFKLFRLSLQLSWRGKH